MVVEDFQRGGPTERQSKRLELKKIKIDPSAKAINPHQKTSLHGCVPILKIY